MISIEVIRTPNGEVIEFTAHGHAGYDDWGQDIVCAAVSALTLSAVNGLMAHAQLQPDVRADEKTGLLHCRLHPDMLRGEAGIKAQAILETMVTGLEEIAKLYSDHIEVKEVVRT